MTGSRVRVFRRVLVGMLIVSTLVLSGCARPVRGQSMASAEAAINAVEGLSGTTDSGGSYAGWVYERWNSARVTLEAGYEVTQWEELLVWLMRELWSMNEDRPTRGVSASIIFADRAVFERWQDDLSKLALPTEYSIRTRDLEVEPRITVAVAARLAKQAGFGRWPGEIPLLPENVVVKIADE